MTKESPIPLLEVQDLHVSVEGKAILKGLTLTVKAGEVHALMGPNGSGKSTLSFGLMGHPKYAITAGKILYRGHDIGALSPDQRAREGIFLAFQYPTAIPGVTIANFLRAALRGIRGADPQVRLHTLVPQRGQISDPDRPVDQPLLQLETQEDVQVVGHLVGLDADQRGRNLVDRRPEGIELHPPQLLGKEFPQLG